MTEIRARNGSGSDLLLRASVTFFGPGWGGSSPLQRDPPLPVVSECVWNVSVPKKSCWGPIGERQDGANWGKGSGVKPGKPWVGGDK